MNSHLPPCLPISSSVGSPPVSGSRRTSASRTGKPSAANLSAIALPIPDDDPVTIAEPVTRALSQTADAARSLSRRHGPSIPPAGEDLRAAQRRDLLGPGGVDVADRRDRVVVSAGPNSEHDAVRYSQRRRAQPSWPLPRSRQFQH